METLVKMGQAGKQAARQLALLSTPTKNQALIAMAQALEAQTAAILAANQADIQAAATMPAKFVDRLKLTPQRIADMAAGLRQVAQLADPVAKYDRGWVTKDGLQIMQRRVPLGVVGIIFEARPLSLIHISEPTRLPTASRMPSSA